MPTKYTRTRYRDEAEELRERYRPRWMNYPRRGRTPRRPARIMLLTLPFVIVLLMYGPQALQRFIPPDPESRVLPGVVVERYTKEAGAGGRWYVLRVRAEAPVDMGLEDGVLTGEMRVEKEAWDQLPKDTAVRLAVWGVPDKGYRIEGVALAETGERGPRASEIPLVVEPAKTGAGAVVNEEAAPLEEERR